MLVLAAAGGVGTLLVQLAAAAGAHVIGAASTAAKRDLARSLGADADVGYDAPDGGPLVRRRLRRRRRAAARAAFERLAPGGRMLSFGLASGSWADVSAEEAAARGVTLVRTGRPAREHTERALAGDLKPVIGQRFPLERAADAHAAIEARATVGKTLLVVQGE